MKRSNRYFEAKENFSSFTPSAIVNMLGFVEGILLARDMLNNEAWDESLQEQAVILLEEIRQTFPQRWNSTWRCDAFLGYAYDIILNYDKRYTAFQRAIDKIEGPPPPQLLVAKAGCCIAPGYPPVSEEEAIQLVKTAIKDTLYIEAVEFLIGLCRSTKKDAERKYWEEVLQKIKETGVHLPPLDEFLEEDFPL